MFEKIRKLQLIILSIVLAFGIVFAAKIVTNSVSKDQIAITGSAERIVKSDKAMLDFDIVARAQSKALAYEKIQQQLPIVTEYLLSKGFLKEDIEIKTSHGYNSYRYTPNGNMTNDVAYYNLSQPISIKSNDVNKIKELSTDITGLIAKGIDLDVNPPAYFYSQLSELKVSLLGEATKNAKERASSMLKATNNRPGKIQSVRMGVMQITPVDSTNVSDYGINDTTTVEKKVTAVANIIFRIK